MGVSASIFSEAVPTHQASSIQDSIASTMAVHSRFDSTQTSPITVQVAHYTPASFPLIPVVDSRTLTICKKSWDTIINTPVRTDGGLERSGMSAFYEEFYSRLDILDENGKFESIIRGHSTDADYITSKGRLLVRIIDLALSLEPGTEDCERKLYNLAMAHNHKQVRPWMYATLIEVLLDTISIRLKCNATAVVMEAWVNLFAFIVRRILPGAIRGLVNETEINVNVTTSVGNSKITEEIAIVSEARIIAKAASRTASRTKGTSATSETSASFVHNLSVSSNHQ